MMLTITNGRLDERYYMSIIAALDSKPKIQVSKQDENLLVRMVHFGIDPDKATKAINKSRQEAFKLLNEVGA
jgi:hypothetical protein